MNTPQQPTAPPDLLDQYQLESLRTLLSQTTGDSISFGDLISAFEDEYNLLINEMKAALTMGDVDSLRSRLHALRGCSLNIGAQALAGLCETYHKAERTLEPSELDALHALSVRSRDALLDFAALN